jgi:hypothetical protein
MFVLLSWALSALPAAAQGFGAIGGTVIDPSNAVLPGVAVTLSASQGTVGSNQQTTSDERGTYQFLRLVPGSYTVKAELQGFRPAEQRNIVVNADVTARADLKMEIGSMAEGVTVTGEAPLLDTTSALKQTVMSHDLLNQLPNRFDLWSMARVMPSVSMSNVDVGGSASFLQSGPTVHGSSNENGYFIDGMDVGQLDSNGNGTIFFADPYAFEEVNLQTAGSGVASMARGGLVYNMITRTGTNQFHGEALFSGSTQGMSSDNFSTALKTQLLATVPAKALAANPNISPSARITKNQDYGAWMSGPIVRDKLWFSYSGHNKVLNEYLAGNYNPDGTQSLMNDYVWTTSGKVAWQVTKSAQLAYTNNLQHRVVGGRNDSGGTYADQYARDVNDKFPDPHQVKFTSPFGQKMVFDVSYNRFRAADRFQPQPGTASDAIAVIETSSQSATIAAPSYSVKPEFRDQFMTTLSYFAGPHDLSLGYQFVESAASMQTYSTSGMRINYTNGVAVSVNTYNVPIGSNGVYDRAGHITNVPDRYHVYDRLQNLYFQDKWVPTKKLVLNLGLRAQKDYAWMPAVCQPATVFVAAQCFPAINGAPNFKDLVPRVSVVYDLAGDGRTALKFGFNQYDTPIVLESVQRVNPVALANDTRAWAAKCAPGQTVGCDVNGDGIPQLNELGPSNGYPAGNANRFAPNLKVPKSTEYTAEIQRQIPGNIVVSVGYTHRLKFNQLAVKNLAVPASSYSPLTVTEVNSQKTVTVYNQAPSLKGQFDNLFYTDPTEDVHYNGADISVNKRISHGWSLMGGLTVGKTIGDPNALVDLNNPNFQAFRHGLVGNDVPWSERLSGVYELPFQVSISGTVSDFVGFPEVTTVLVNQATVALTQGQQTVWVAPRGSTRLPHVFQADMTLRRSFRVQGGTFEPRIDFYNLTNEASIIGRVTQLGSAYLRASAVQPGRLIKIGGNFTF